MKAGGSTLPSFHQGRNRFTKDVAEKGDNLCVGR